MDDNQYPDLAVGSYTSDRVVYLRSLPIVDLDIEIVIPITPVDLDDENKALVGDANQEFPGTTLQICFTPKSEFWQCWKLRRSGLISRFNISH